MLNNENAVQTNASNRYDFYNNHFEKNGIDIGANYIQLGGQSIIQIHENNFIGTTLFIFNQKQGSVKDTVRAENNWWGTADLQIIKEKIMDCEDLAVLKCVEVDPIRTQVFTNAGVQP